MQEYFQSLGLSLPKYKTRKVAGEDHNPKWQSTVTLPDGSQFTGHTKCRKVDAECSAAKKAIKNMDTEDMSEDEKEITKPKDRIRKKKKKKEKQTTSIDTAPKIMLIDLENIFLNDKMLQYLVEDDTTHVIGFISAFHSNADKEYPIEVYKINSPAKEAADHAMSFHAGYLTTILSQTREDYPQFIIVSRDTSAANLVALIRQYEFEAEQLPSIRSLAEKYDK